MEIQKRKIPVLRKKATTQNRFRSETEQEQTGELQEKLFDKLSNVINKLRQNRLKDRAVYFYGRNFPIFYKEKFGFRERWEEQRKEENNFLDIMQEQNFSLQILFAIIMLMNMSIIWILTVKAFFQSGETSCEIIEAICSIGLLSRTISALLNIYIKQGQSDGRLGVKKVLKIIKLDIASCILFVLLMTSINKNNVGVLLLEGIVIVYLYLEARKIYKFLGFLGMSLFCENKYKILDLMINLIITIHFFSLVMIATTWGSNSLSWITQLGIQNEDYITKYVYSFYFCSTTILTVGYGDISPRNIREICVVTVIQFFGVVFFGYLMSQIGFNLSIMRKSEENLQKNFRTVSRIQNFYNIDKSLINKTKGFLVDNQNYADELTPEEENGLLQKLNEELRDELSFERTLSVIKSSIFFVCRWSKQIQCDFSLKMQKLLISPNERLPQPFQNQRIYIINKGKVNVYLDRFGPNNIMDRRKVKVIKAKDKNQISDNIYGYTAVISNRKCALDATASQFTSCFYISKKDFDQCVNANSRDRQYYHEIKDKIDSSQFGQAFEAPSILNIREHYHPSSTVLIRKKKAEFSKLRNGRKYEIRYSRKEKKKLFLKTLKLVQEIKKKLLRNQDSSEQIKFETCLQLCCCEPNIEGNMQISPECNPNNHSSPVPEQKLQEAIITKIQEAMVKSFDNRETKTMIERNIRDEDGRVKTLLFVDKSRLTAKFERSFHYSNYFVEGNLENVLLRLSQQNYMHNKMINICRVPFPSRPKARQIFIKKKFR